ncbi:hypothetical protein L207DRAFT_592518 [Hyaloscypha variabilis F]|uniref:Uncharacterized protein n=1 Tax=Hyaloscypha variabilis (strain UAMH 11265 / GT02V1 / F) TaxID=1149755 RepID=A0A2J6QVV7_HYAVF|nr:hypothetical protein L207DRAFT_592518 [Hyaloscypha variabilis F]
MSNPEAAPLNPADVEAPSRDAQSSPPHDELHDLLELDLRRRKRAPLHILILYGLSFVASGGGLGAALLGYIITLTAPLDDYQRKQHRESYEKVFVGMKSVVILLTINIFWSAFNFYLACKGWQDYPWLLNVFYDLVMGVSLVAFGVINMMRMLLDHVACDGSGDREMERKCDTALLRILIVEMIAISLGFLVTVFLHILLVGRCCAYIHRMDGSLKLGAHDIDDEDVLLALIERRRRRRLQQEETEGGEARRGPGHLSAPSAETVGVSIDQYDGRIEQTEDDLIDMEAEER